MPGKGAVVYCRERVIVDAHENDDDDEKRGMDAH